MLVVVSALVINTIDVRRVCSSHELVALLDATPSIDNQLTVAALTMAGRLRARPSSALQRLVTEAAAKVETETFAPRDLTAMCWGVAKVYPRHIKSKARDDFFRSVARTDPGEYEARQLATTAWAFANAGCAHQRFCRDLAKGLGTARLEARDCAQAAWALAKMMPYEKKAMRHVAQTSLRCADKLRPYELALVAWAFAKTRTDGLGDLEPRVVRVLDQLNPRQLGNVAWAFAKMNATTPAFWDAFVEIDFRDAPAQALANAAWALATSRKRVSLETRTIVFERIRVAILTGNRLDFFKPQELANTAWAFAKTGEASFELFDAIAKCVVGRIEAGDSFEPQELASVAWAFAKNNHADAALFRVVAEQPVDAFDAHALANTVWAFATLGFDGLDVRAATLRKLPSFNSQDLANTAWALAKLNTRDDVVFTAIARGVVAKIDRFNSQELANTAWAFAKTSVANPLFDVLAVAAVRKIHTFNAQELANMAWAFAKRGRLGDNAKLATALAAAATQSIDTFEPQHLANTAWAFAKAGVADHDLFKAIADAGKRRRHSFASPARAQLRQAALFLRHKAPHIESPNQIDDDLDLDNDASSPILPVKPCPHVVEL